VDTVYSKAGTMVHSIEFERKGSYNTPNEKRMRIQTGAPESRNA
jgi:hypothetical protein